MSTFTQGDKVEWNWGNGTGTGQVVKRYTQKITMTIKDNEVTREASDDCPAYLIKQEDGDQVLKSHSEVTAG